MEIKLERSDEKIPMIEPSAREIAKYILHGKKELFQVFSDTLLSCSTYTGNTFLDEKIMKNIDTQKRLYPHIAAELECLKNLMWNYFSYIEDYEFDLLLKINSKYYGDVSDEQKKLSKLRGVLLEIFVEEMVRPRYQNEIFHTGCKVIINGEEVVSRYGGEARLSIDIAACKDAEGEFYECKLSPNSLNAKSYKYLDLLERRLSRERRFKNIVGCVTLGSERSLRNAQTQIEQDLGIHNENIKSYGRERLLSLSGSPFDEAI